MAASVSRPSLGLLDRVDGVEGMVQQAAAIATPRRRRTPRHARRPRAASPRRRR